MRLADIDFSVKKMYYCETGEHAPPNRISQDEYFFLIRLEGPYSKAYKTIAFPYYRKLYVYYDRFGDHMPDSLRIALLQEIEDSVDG